MEDTGAAKNTTTTGATFGSPLFSFSKPSGASLGFGFGFDSGAPPPPPPPVVEVQISEVPFHTTSFSAFASVFLFSWL
jgi:hypothetical protein